MIHLRLIVLLILGGFSNSCDADGGLVFVDRTIDIQTDYSKFESGIFTLVNRYRRKNGLDTLSVSGIVSAQAKKHTDYMVSRGKLSHDNFYFRDMNLTSILGAESVGENVGCGYSYADGIFTAWVESVGHKKVMLNNKYTHFGISAKKDGNGVIYVTNIFIKKP